jgi:predicted dienelactone hydrolase
MRRKFGWKIAIAGVATIAVLGAFGIWLVSFIAFNTRVPLPDDLELTPPGKDVPSELATFAGVWGGDRWDGVLPHALAVEKIEADGSAKVVFAWGTDRAAQLTHEWVRLDARVTGGRLTMTLPNRNVAEYAVTGNGRLLGRYTTPAGWRGYVILKRIDAPTRAAVIAEAAKRADPLWQEIDIPERSRVGAAAGETLTLETTVYRTEHPGRRPLIVLNHGTTGGLSTDETYRYEPQARFFLALGYSVAIPMRKGRGDSDGPLVEREDFKGPPQVEIDSGIEDIDTVVEYMKTQPYVDPARIVLAGQQRGGLLAAVYAARYPEKVSGVINFSGGWWPEAIHGGPINTEMFAAAGRGAKVPTLWLYAEGDPYYSQAHIERNYAAFRAAGGRGRLVEVPDPGAVKAYGNDLFEWTAKWEDDVLDYLNEDARPAWDAGVKLVSIDDPLEAGSIEGAVFYPTAAPAGATEVGIWALDARPEAPVANGRFPLILLSHDYGGTRFSHNDSAIYLARRGFVVMALTHPGDDPRDPGGWWTDRALIGREYDLRAALDGILADLELGPHINADRIDVAGHGLGGYSALVLAGAKPDFARLARYCRDPSAADATCTAETGPPAIRPGLGLFQDPRIKAAFLMAPGPGYLFDRDGLKAVTIPIHIDEPTDDRAMKAAHNAERIRDLLPSPPEYVRLKDVGHDVFVAPCPGPLRAGIPEICTDAPGIDRVAIHRQVNAEMADFFRRALAAP